METVQPKLRFPEFNSNWKRKTLGEIFSIFNGYAFSSSDSIENGVLWVKIADVGVQQMKKDNLSFLPIEYIEKHKKFILKKDDYVIALTRPILNGKLKIAKIDDFFNDSLLNQRVGKLITSNNSTFVFNILQRDLLIKSIENNISGSDPPNLSPNEISYIESYIPSLEEQTRIANFLSSVDEKLNLLKEKKDLLEDYKKGIMQKIFNQDPSESEQAKQIRFKDDNGEDFEEWEEKTLGEIGDVITGKTPSTSDSELWNGDIQFITPTDIKEGNKYQESTARYVTNNAKLKILPAKSIVYTCIASIGKMCISKYPSITNQQINSLIINQLNNFEYVYYWLYYITPFIKSTQANTTLPIINKTDFSKFSILMPCLKEQTKIANFLSAIDEKIELVTNQIQDTQEYKKGLLQQMFV